MLTLKKAFSKLIIISLLLVAIPLQTVMAAGERVTTESVYDHGSINSMELYSATDGGTVTARGIEYGEDVSYGYSVPSDDLIDDEFSIMAENLSCGVTYHYRAYGVFEGVDETLYGDDVAFGLSNCSEVTIATNVSAIYENNSFVFTIQRIGMTYDELTVNLDIGGTATPVDDYCLSNGGDPFVVIPAGETSVTLSSSGCMDDGAPESTETIVVGITPGDGYTIGDNNEVTVEIYDGEEPVEEEDEDAIPEYEGSMTFDVVCDGGECVATTGENGFNLLPSGDAEFYSAVLMGQSKTLTANGSWNGVLSAEAGEVDDPSEYGLSEAFYIDLTKGDYDGSLTLSDEPFVIAEYEGLSDLDGLAVFADGEALSVCTEDQFPDPYLFEDDGFFLNPGEACYFDGAVFDMNDILYIVTRHFSEFVFGDTATTGGNGGSGGGGGYKKVVDEVDDGTDDGDTGDTVEAVKEVAKDIVKTVETVKVKKEVVTLIEDPAVDSTKPITELFAKTTGDSTVAGLDRAIVSSNGFVLSGTVEPNSKVSVKVGNDTYKTTADINGHYLIPVGLWDVEGLLDVEITVNGVTSTISVRAKNSTLPRPTIDLQGKNVLQTKSFTAEQLIEYIKQMNEGWVRDANTLALTAVQGTEYSNTVIARIEVKNEGKNTNIIVKGTAQPGSTVILAYKSVIYSSVVIADKNGDFTAEVPRDLTAELKADKTLTEVQHEIIAFSVDYETNEVSPFVRDLFKIYK